MIAVFKPSKLSGTIAAPPSKSMAHRYLIGAALSGEVCTLTGVDYSEDILASMDCLTALGARITTHGDAVTMDPTGFLQADAPILPCRESGSTLRFFIPLALCMGRPVTLLGSKRLLERPLSVYEDLCREKGFTMERGNGSITVCGSLQSGCYEVRGDISSQFITGLMLALIYRNEDAVIKVLPPFESRSYIDLTIAALRSFGAEVAFTDTYTIAIKKSVLHGYGGRIEGDYSNAAFLDAFNLIGSQVVVENLSKTSLQGDRVYGEYYQKLINGTPTLDLSDCPDLGPILFAMAALKNGAVFTGTDRLKAKESDRGAAMDAELRKLGGGLIFGSNTITVPKQQLKDRGEMLFGHNDHRIVMALSVILTQTGGAISGAEAIKKSYPGFFTDLIKLGAKVELT
ncbi:MAG: 3-phosphoshikimate 1-carboxyvinyltransferase [Clostridiales bacterium]|nr:3-phosphoshikimate 1-carboxyvinyltransferase [Clostridiales bacterium]